MTHWLVIGGGPDAGTDARKVSADKTIGCNGSLRLGVPHDLYWLSDPVALTRFAEDLRGFTGEVVGPKGTPFDYIEKGIEFHGRCSGVVCCRVAIARGATRLTLVGFQGYKPTDSIIDKRGKPVALRGDYAATMNEAMRIAFADIGALPVAVDVVGASCLTFPKHWRRIL